MGWYRIQTFLDFYIFFIFTRPLSKFVFIISRLSRLKPVLPSQMLMYIYTSIIQPKIDFMQYRYGAIRPHITLIKCSGCKTELQEY